MVPTMGPCPSRSVKPAVASIGQMGSVRSAGAVPLCRLGPKLRLREGREQWAHPAGQAPPRGADAARRQLGTTL